MVKYTDDNEEWNKKFEHPWMCKEGDGNAFVVWGYKD